MSAKGSSKYNEYDDSESDDVLQHEDVWVVIDETHIEESTTSQPAKDEPHNPTHTTPTPQPQPPSIKDQPQSIEMVQLGPGDADIDVVHDSQLDGHQYIPAGDDHGIYVACREVAFPSTTTTVVSHISTIHYPGTVTMLLGEGSNTYLRLLSGVLHNESSYEGTITYNTFKFSERGEEISSLIGYYTTDRASYIGTVKDFLQDYSTSVASQTLPFHPDHPRNPGKIPSPYQPFQFRFNYQYMLDMFHFPNQPNHLESLLYTKMSHLTDEEQYIVHCIQLMLSPKLLLLIDSPPSTISHSNLEILSSLFQSWACKTNGVVVFAVHGTAVISHITLTYVNHTLLFHKGSVIYQGPTVDLLPYSIAIGFTPPLDCDVIEFIQSYLVNPKAVRDQLQAEDRDRAIRVLERKVGFSVLPKDENSVRREETEAIIDKDESNNDDDIVSVSRFAYSQNIGVKSVRSGFVIITKILEEEKRDEDARIERLDAIAESTLNAAANKEMSSRKPPREQSAFRSVPHSNPNALNQLKYDENNPLPTLSTYGVLPQCVSVCDTKDMLLGYFRSSPFFKAIMPDIELLTDGVCQSPSFYTIPIMNHVDPKVVAEIIAVSEQNAIEQQQQQQHQQQQAKVPQRIDEEGEDAYQSVSEDDHQPGDGSQTTHTTVNPSHNNNTHHNDSTDGDGTTSHRRPEGRLERELTSDRGELVHDDSDFYSCVEYRDSTIDLTEDQQGFMVVPSNLQDQINGDAGRSDGSGGGDATSSPNGDGRVNSDGSVKDGDDHSQHAVEITTPSPPQYSVLPPQINSSLPPSVGFHIKQSTRQAVAMLFGSSPVHLGTVVFQVWFAVLMLIIYSTMHSTTDPEDIHARLSMLYFTILLSVMSTLFLLPVYHDQHRFIYFSVVSQTTHSKRRFIPLFVYLFAEFILHAIVSFILTVPYWYNTSHVDSSEYAGRCLFIVLITLRTIYIATGINRCMTSLLTSIGCSNITVFGILSLVHSVFIAISPQFISDDVLPTALKFTRYLSPYNWSYYALVEREFSSQQLTSFTLPFDISVSFGTNWNIISTVGAIILVVVLYGIYILTVALVSFKFTPNYLLLHRRLPSMASFTLPLHATTKRQQLQHQVATHTPPVPLLEIGEPDIRIPLHQLNVVTSLVQSHITLKGVTLSTSSNRDVLFNLNMYLEPGKVTLFTGPTGSHPNAFIELLAKASYYNGQPVSVTCGDLLVNDQAYGKLPPSAIGIVEAPITFPKQFTVDTLVQLYSQLFLSPLTNGNNDLIHKILEELIDVCQCSHLMLLSLSSLLPSETIIVSLLLTLIQGPSIVLVRDPFIFVRDAPFMKAFLKILRQVALSGRTVVISSSIPLTSETFYECDRIGIVVRGGHQIIFSDVGYRGRLFHRQIVKYPGLSAMLYSNPLTFLFSTLDTSLTRHIRWVYRPEQLKHVLIKDSSSLASPPGVVPPTALAPNVKGGDLVYPLPQQHHLRKNRRNSLNHSSSNLQAAAAKLGQGGHPTNGPTPDGYNPYEHMFATDSFFDKEHQSRVSMQEFMNEVLNYYYTSVSFDRVLNLIERGRKMHQEQQKNVMESAEHSDVVVPSLPLPRHLSHRCRSWLILFGNELRTFFFSHYLPLPFVPAIFSILLFAMYHTCSTITYDQYSSDHAYLTTIDAITAITTFQFDQILFIPIALAILPTAFYAVSYHLYARLYYAYLYRHKHVPLALVVASITMIHIIMSLIATIFTVFPFYFLMNFTITPELFLRFFFPVFLSSITITQFTLCLSLIFRNPLIIRLIQVGYVLTSLLFSGIFQSAHRMYIGLQYISLLLPIPRCLDALRALAYPKSLVNDSTHYLMTSDIVLAYWVDVLITIGWIIVLTLFLLLCSPRLISRLYHHHHILDNNKIKRILW